ncbi:MAG TPA: bifunctional enoyl-CoA hydratase/phosphate acetyltransferase [Thermodesulfobacteriota bacterium]|nr:bifunctional enoyl-CoA hydratase/phosphate acetyltransferase [Thermodesulfobacteriota bacterium]
MTEGTITNKTFDEIKIGDTASITKTLGRDDVEKFAALSGDMDPCYLDEGFAGKHNSGKLIAPSMWCGLLASALLGSELPGPGTQYVSQSLDFIKRIASGDTITLTMKVASKEDETGKVDFDCVCVNGEGETVMTGTAAVIAPREKISVERTEGPEIIVKTFNKYENFVQKCSVLESPLTAVAHPCDESSLTAAVEAWKEDLIVPVLVGPVERIIKIAKEHGLDISGLRVVDAPHSHASAAEAMRLVREGECEALMKGSLHTDELIAEVVKSDTGLRTERRISHAFVMDVPTYPKTLIISDAAINIYPDLDEKADICRNAIELAQMMGVPEPKVAILSAVETVTSKIQSTVDAAALCKMADRGQIEGGILDGPLAFDNAISRQAADIKGIKSEVAGDADIMIVPDLEAGNMLAKQLTYMARAESAGVVLGARVPIVLTSRSDSLRSKLASCAIVALMVHARKPIKA